MAIRYEDKLTVSNKPAPVSNTVSNKPVELSRIARWRAAHREEYRAYMREYMRKRRAKS